MLAILSWIVLILKKKKKSWIMPLRALDSNAVHTPNFSFKFLLPIMINVKWVFFFFFPLLHHITYTYFFLFFYLFFIFYKSWFFTFIKWLISYSVSQMIITWANLCFLCNIMLPSTWSCIIMTILTGLCIIKGIQCCIVKLEM